MPQHMHAKNFSWLLLAVAIFICTACGSDGSASNTSQKQLMTHSSVSQTVQKKIHLPAGPITYVALGASDAVGVGSNQPQIQGYVPLLAARLPQGSHLVNLGISGIRLHEALSQELPLAISTSPDLVTIWLVANDFVGGVSYDDYMRDLNTFLSQLHTNTHAVLVMGNLPDLTRLPAFSNLTSAKKAAIYHEIERWNTKIAELAAKYDVILVDLFSQQSQLTAHPEYVSIDGFHPSPAGYVQLANSFWNAIKG